MTTHRLHWLKFMHLCGYPDPVACRISLDEKASIFIVLFKF